MKRQLGRPFRWFAATQVGRATICAYHWPGDLLARVPVRQRRSAAAWVFITATALFIPFRNVVAYVSALSVVALLGIVTGETPVEEEGDDPATA